jgi:leader peptidase (prepilin peptidase)/N-methyltransferase
MDTLHTLTLASSPYSGLILIYVGLLSLMVGSFLNVVIHRLPQMLEKESQIQCRELLNIHTPHKDAPPPRLSRPRSFCPHCKHSLWIRDLIPLLSYALLGGKCRNCKGIISARYVLVELLTVVSSLLVIYQLGLSILGFGTLLLTWLLIVLVFIDIEHMILPDALLYISLWLGLLMSSYTLMIPAEAAILGAVLGYLSLWSIYWTFKVVTQKEGLGYGDFKLTAVFGAWLGSADLPLVLVLASLSGILFAIVRHLSGKGHYRQAFAFGPHIALAGWLMILYGHRLPFEWMRYPL